MEIYAPNLPSSNEIAGGAVFFTPNQAINDYAVFVNPFNPDITHPITNPVWQIRGINPDYSAGLFL